MKPFINTLHFFCVAFTFVIFGICAANLMLGYPVSISGETIAANTVLIILLLFVSRFMGMLNIKNRAVRVSIDFAAKYAVVMIVCTCFLLHYQLPLAENLIQTSALFAAVYAGSYLYHRKKAQMNAEEINRLLDKHNS